ncbi:MAG: hypothetical protein LBP29_04345 [Treponema sp.]|jgi:hypothetical protein|nr:hypothetical protein [Treponema sp.]
MKSSMKRWFLLPAVFFFSLGALSAATVSFLVVETGLAEESARPQSSLLWENGLMDVFFDAGHIVSNAPIMRIPEKTAEKLPDPARIEFDQARNGGADYFIMILLEYPPSALNGIPGSDEVSGPPPNGTSGGTGISGGTGAPGGIPVSGGKPEKVYMRIFSVSNETLVYEIACAGTTRLDANEELIEVKKNAAKLVPQLKHRG